MQSLITSNENLLKLRALIPAGAVLGLAYQIEHNAIDNINHFLETIG